MCATRKLLLIVNILDTVLLAGLIATIIWKGSDFKGCADQKFPGNSKSCSKFIGYYSIYSIIILISAIRCSIGWLIYFKSRRFNGRCGQVTYLILSLLVLIVGLIFMIVYYDYHKGHSSVRVNGVKVYLTHWAVDLTLATLIIILNSVCTVIGSIMLFY